MRILDAAIERLQHVGPAGLKLTELAKSLGLSHPAILHHFGNRAGLVAAVVRRAMEGLHHELSGGLRVVDDPEKGAAMLLDRAFEVLDDRGYGRMLAWLALSGRTADDGYTPLARLSEVLHAVRTREVGEVDPEDTTFAVLLAVFALIGYSVVGPAAFDMADLDEDAAARFRVWMRGAMLRVLDAPGDDVDDGAPES